jgi:hypothetical protein
MPISRDHKEQLLRLLEQDVSDTDLLDQASPLPSRERVPEERGRVRGRSLGAAGTG